jgi:hypothetical protein
VKLVDFVGQLRRMRSLLTFVGSVAAVWVLDYSLFERFGIDVRDRDTGMWLTGFMVAGLTVPWRALFGWLTQNRAELDETLGDHTRSLRSAA